MDTYEDGKFALEEPTSDKFVTAEEIKAMENESNSTASSEADSASQG